MVGVPSEGVAGEARAGVIKLQASKTSSSSQRFTGAAANGGWNDSYTVTGGTGQGLGYLEKISKSFEAGDYSAEIIAIARRHYGDRIEIHHMAMVGSGIAYDR